MKIIFFSLVCFICAVACVEEASVRKEGTPMQEEHSFDGHKFVMKIRGKRSLPAEEVEAKGHLKQGENHHIAPNVQHQPRYKRNPSARPMNKASVPENERRMRRSAPRFGHRANSK